MHEKKEGRRKGTKRSDGRPCDCTPSRTRTDQILIPAQHHANINIFVLHIIIRKPKPQTQSEQTNKINHPNFQNTNRAISRRGRACDFLKRQAKSPTSWIIADFTFRLTTSLPPNLRLSHTAHTPSSMSLFHVSSLFSLLRSCLPF